jgi:hypothetical protein
MILKHESHFYLNCPMLDCKTIQCLSCNICMNVSIPVLYILSLMIGKFLVNIFKYPMASVTNQKIP